MTPGDRVVIVSCGCSCRTPCIGRRGVLLGTSGRELDILYYRENRDEHWPRIGGISRARFGGHTWEVVDPCR